VDLWFLPQSTWLIVKNFLIRCDANAHHVLWGSSNVNPRGEVLSDFIAGQDLHIINRGHKPTFVVANRREVLDVTLTSGSLLESVCECFVDSQESSSDHKYIRCNLSLGLRFLCKSGTRGRQAGNCMRT
jgi:hypothetical protein